MKFCSLCVDDAHPMDIKKTFPDLDCKQETVVLDDRYGVCFITEHHDRWYTDSGTIDPILAVFHALLATVTESEQEVDFAIAICRLNEDGEILYLIDELTFQKLKFHHQRVERDLVVVEGDVKPFTLTEI